MVNRKTAKFSMEVKKTVDKGVLYRNILPAQCKLNCCVESKFK